MAGIDLDLATIIAAVLEGVLYGFSLLMFFMTLYLMFSEPTWSKSSRIMLPASILFFIYSTMHVAIDIARLEKAFIRNRLTEGGPIGYLEDVSDMMHIYKNAIYGLHTFTADFVVVYRAYMVWRRIWVAILPSILILGTITCSWSLLIQFGEVAGSKGDILFSQNLTRWVEGFFATSLSANLLATGLLAYKIWTVDSDAAFILSSTRNHIKHVLRVVADSGALYSASIIALLICYAAKSNAQYILLDMMMPIISIAFYMIILRLAFARRYKRKMSTLALSTLNAPSGPIPMRRMHVQLKTEVETTADLSALEASEMTKTQSDPIT